jgi:ribose 5-phosphate isomerase B
MIYLAADHNGYEMKEKIKEYLTQKGIDFEDMGPYAHDKDDDYPDFAYLAAKKVAQNPQHNRGILLCGSGVGMALVANKVTGVYCAQVWNRKMARGAREHNGINTISFGVDYTDQDEIFASIEEFLSSPAKTAERHLRRFKKVQEVEGKA